MSIVNRDIDYKKYLLSPQWKEKRAVALNRAGNRCQLCNSKNKLEVHHRTYERIGVEIPEDLTVLCHECHSYFSAKGKRIKQKKEKQRLKKNNPLRMIDKEISRLSYQIKISRWSELERLKRNMDELKIAKKKLIEGK